MKECKANSSVSATSLGICGIAWPGTFSLLQAPAKFVDPNDNITKDKINRLIRIVVVRIFNFPMLQYMWRFDSTTNKNWPSS